LIWSAYDYYVKGNPGWQFAIFLIENAVYWYLRVIFNKRMS